MLAGITLVANGVELKYPFEVCIRNLLNCCDKVFVSTDIENRDDTLSRLLMFGERIEVIQTAWDWSVTNGTDLAYRANQCAKVAFQEGYDSVLYVQADEIVHPNEILRLRKQQQCVLQLERTYFWRDLNHINSSWTVPILRMGPLDKNFQVLGDGMYAKFSSNYSILSVPPGVARIYHYSRVGESKDIARRLNCLDTLFHDEGTYEPLGDYIFGRNNNFESGAATAQVVSAVGIIHPPGVLNFYGATPFGDLL